MPRPPHDLGQGGGIAEHVGQPDVVGLDPELLEVEALAVDDLADQRLARRNVAVRLHPHAPGRLEAASAIRAFSRAHRARVVVAHPGQVLGLGDGEAVLGITVHQRERRAETCEHTCGPSRGGATATPCPDGRGPRCSTACVPGAGRRASISCRTGCARRQLPEMSGSSSRLQARSRPATDGRDAARCRGAPPCSSTSTRKSCQNASNSGSRTWRSAWARVNSGTPSGSGSSIGHGLAPNGDGGLAAASTNSSTSSPPRRRPC